MPHLLKAQMYTAVDGDGNTLESRKAPKKRVLTHAVILQSEKTDLVARRHATRIAEDTKLLSAIREAATVGAVVRSAGQAGGNEIMIQAPVQVRAIVVAVYGVRANVAAAVEVYECALREAESDLLERISKSEDVLEQLKTGTYILQSARVVTWCTNHAAARVRVSVFEASTREPWYLLGLKVTTVLGTARM